jgi:TRAP-type transport system small permease protein
VLLTEGSWKQTVLNWDTVAPASGLSVGLFYAAGIAFGASSCAIILHELYRLVTGQIADADLVAISESEELPHAPDAAGGKQQA